MDLVSNCKYTFIMSTISDIFVRTVDSEEIRRLSKYFKKLDLNNDGELSVDEFMSIPELQQNPLVRRVIEIMDEDGNGQIDFREFIQGLSQFSLKSDKQSKLKCKETRNVL